jgi:hypothetical protein
MQAQERREAERREAERPRGLHLEKVDNKRQAELNEPIVDLVDNGKRKKKSKKPKHTKGYPQEEDECTGESERESKTHRRRTSAQALMPCSFITILAYPPAHTHTHTN